MQWPGVNSDSGLAHLMGLITLSGVIFAAITSRLGVVAKSISR